MRAARSTPKSSIASSAGSIEGAAAFTLGGIEVFPVEGAVRVAVRGWMRRSWHRNRRAQSLCEASARRALRRPLLHRSERSKLRRAIALPARSTLRWRRNWTTRCERPSRRATRSQSMRRLRLGAARRRPVGGASADDAASDRHGRRRQRSAHDRPPGLEATGRFPSETAHAPGWPSACRLQPRPRA